MTDRTKVSFTKQHTQIAKGVAILLMVYHHLFVIPGRLNNNYSTLLHFEGFQYEVKIAVFCKICVAIYLFVSGIGLFYSLSKEDSIFQMYRKALSKLLRFMLNYWIILLIVFPIGVYLGVFRFDLITVVKAMIGSSDIVSEWWFVRQYIVLVLLSPLFVSLLIKKPIMAKLIYILMLAAVFIVSLLISKYSEYNSILAYVSEIVGYVQSKICILTFIIGMICARFNLYRFFADTNRIRFVVKNIVIMIAVIAIRMALINDPTSMSIDYIIAPLFTFSITSLLASASWLKRIPIFFSYHSTNIWLIHMFWCYYFWQDIVLLPRYSILIFIWLLFLSVASSILINCLYYPIMKKLFGIKVIIFADGLI